MGGGLVENSRPSSGVSVSALGLGHVDSLVSFWPLTGLLGGLSTHGKLSFSLSMDGRSLPKLVFQSRMSYSLILLETLFF